jgi:hypothetical protein
MTAAADVSTVSAIPARRDRPHADRRVPGRVSTTARATVLLVAAASLGLVACMTRAPAPRDGDAAPVFGVTIPPGYRDWKLISVAHEAGDLDDLRAVLGNEIAIAAYREGRSPFPDGTIIARLAWRHSPSAANNSVFGREQSFVAGAATNVQFMVKDSVRHAATGGWGYAQFDDGKPADAKVHGTCVACHAKAPDAVFTRYAR